MLAVLPVGARSRLPKSNNLKGSSLEMGAGVGWSSLCYTLTDGSNTGAAHFSAHVGYSYFFNRYVGVGLGVDFARYGSFTYYSDALFEWQGVLDSDGELYTHQTQLNRWREVQSLYAVSVPLVAQFAVPINRSLQFILMLVSNMRTSFRAVTPLRATSRTAATIRRGNSLWRICRPTDSTPHRILRLRAS